MKVWIEEQNREADLVYMVEGQDIAPDIIGAREPAILRDGTRRVVMTARGYEWWQKALATYARVEQRMKLVLPALGEDHPTIKMAEELLASEHDWLDAVEETDQILSRAERVIAGRATDR